MPKANENRIRNQDKIYTYPEFQEVAKKRNKHIYETVTKPLLQERKKEKKRLNIRAGGNLLFSIILLSLSSVAQPCNSHDDCATSLPCQIPYCNNGVCVTAFCQRIEMECRLYDGTCTNRRCNYVVPCCCYLQGISEPQRALQMRRSKRDADQRYEEATTQKFSPERFFRKKQYLEQLPQKRST